MQRVGRVPDGTRTTVLVGLLLGTLLLVGAVVAPVLDGDDPTVPAPAPAAATGSSVPSPSTTSPARMVPRPGAVPVQRLGRLGERSRIVSGRGGAELRYVRAPRNGTRLHFICTGCDATTRLVGRPSDAVVGGGPPADPTDVTVVLDAAVEPGRPSRLVVDAPAAAEWTVTLTPFDVVPVHVATFDGLGDDVVAVRARGDLRLTCVGESTVRTLARARGAAEYAVGETVRHPGGTVEVPAPMGTDHVVVVVGCAGRWTLTLP